ncbi:MAG: ABC transporter ATP-binding protein [Bacilli bacterium]
MVEVLRLKNVEKMYGNKKQVTQALNGVSFEVEQGEWVAIMGASGSGKTTILNCIATIDTVSAGEIIVDGCDLRQLKGKKLEQFRGEKLGFIFQDFQLLDTLTAYENIALALTLHGKAEHVKERVHTIARKLNIVEILNKFPYELSGGQKQRVASARALVTEPNLVLADEPTGSLDSKSARQLLEALENSNQQDASTILMVTHDPFTASFSTRVLFMKDGEIFSQITKGIQTRKAFFEKILDVVSLLGGEHIDCTVSSS